MELRKLGQSDLNVSVIAFGACALAGARNPAQVLENAGAPDSN